MPEYVVLADAWSRAASDEHDPMPHHEYHRGETVDLEDNEATEALVAAGTVQPKADYEDAQTDPAELPPSGDVVQGRGVEGDAPVLVNEDPEPKGGKSSRKQD